MQETQIWSSASFWKRNTILLVAAATTPPKPSAFPSNLDCVIKNPLWCCTDAKLKTFMILTVDVVMPWVPFDKIFWAVSKDPNRNCTQRHQSFLYHSILQSMNCVQNSIWTSGFNCNALFRTSRKRVTVFCFKLSFWYATWNLKHDTQMKLWNLPSCRYALAANWLPFV